MTIVESINEWTQSTFLPFGASHPTAQLGLFTLSFAESSFFPIPPDILLAIMCLEAAQNSGGELAFICILFGLIATVGSVMGAILGYWIGLKGGRPMLKKYGGSTGDKVQQYYDRYGEWGVGIAGFSPIPYKIFTIASGIFNMNLPKMLFVSFIARGARFMGEAVLIMFYGQYMYDLVNNDLAFGAISLVTVMVVFVAWYVLPRIRGRSPTADPPDEDGPEAQAEDSSE